MHSPCADYVLNPMCTVQGVQIDEAQEEGLGPLLLLDTAGCDMDEQAEDGSGSKYNDGEAEVPSLAAFHVS